MANASAKRIASQNAGSVKLLRLGLLAVSVLSFILRILFRQGSLSPRRLSFWLYSFSMIPSTFMSQYLIRIGTPKHESSTGALISSGEDLSRSGIIEWCFDVIYITWACQVLTGIFGDWVWWLYSIIPAYAFYKLWNSTLSSLLFGRSSGSSDNVENDDGKQAPSKRQEKLRKRSERGDPRVRVQGSR
ncbi:hypothetical protein QCA50_000260 [Cerrena zonata]|uniref:DUF788-domain-containing protein n=1 Tax=Cerrena zonata TaxID=2478898 RepID=A0AAW0GUG3_9APHY